jgi:hypothetical protein
MTGRQACMQPNVVSILGLAGACSTITDWLLINRVANLGILLALLTDFDYQVDSVTPF